MNRRWSGWRVALDKLIDGVLVAARRWFLVTD
jgi:hypothetical protein